MKGCCVVSGSGKEMMVTIHEDPTYLFFEALKAGAAGYVLTDATRTELIGAVRKVLSGESLLTPELATRPLRKLASENNAEQAARALEPVW
jgi:DNA-binding NarL/FixJ family response regulator